MERTSGLIIILQSILESVHVSGCQESVAYRWHNQVSDQGVGISYCLEFLRVRIWGSPFYLEALSLASDADQEKNDPRSPSDGVNSDFVIRISPVAP
jgi:hypothetical protein